MNRIGVSDREANDSSIGRGGGRGSRGRGAGRGSGGRGADHSSRGGGNGHIFHAAGAGRQTPGTRGQGYENQQRESRIDISRLKTKPPLDQLKIITSIINSQVAFYFDIP